MKERSAFTRLFWFALGLISLVIGLVGVLLPLLPGIPFLILGVVCMWQAFKRDRVFEQLEFEALVRERRRQRYL